MEASGRQQPWGRVDDEGRVYVREGTGEREVGQFPDGSAEEALAYFEHKYTELAGQVALLEQRARRGAPAQDLVSAVTALRESLPTAAAVGDLGGLGERLERLSAELDTLVEEQSLQSRKEREAALAERTAIVEEAESIAATDPEKTVWKEASARFDAVFARWQEHQRTGPRLPKGKTDALWKRFRSARTTFERHRRAFFAELDAEHKEAKVQKTTLVERAEALAPRGIEGIGEYRRLMTQWKAIGRAGRRVDDTLWARFKAAGDVLYAAKAELDAKEREELAENLTLKLALLEEAEVLLSATDRLEARRTLTDLQRRWEAAGRVPKENLREVERRMRAVEDAVKRLEQEHWKRNDPEKKARANDLSSQLTEAIETLSAELAEAKESGDEARIAAATEALEARRSWLEALG